VHERIGLVDDNHSPFAEERNRIEFIADRRKIDLVAGKRRDRVLGIGLANNDRHEQRDYAALEEILVAREDVVRLPTYFAVLVDKGESVHLSEVRAQRSGVGGQY
jgi:hypothetical protein